MDKIRLAALGGYWVTSPIGGGDGCRRWSGKGELPYIVSLYPVIRNMGNKNLSIGCDKENIPCRSRR